MGVEKKLSERVLTKPDGRILFKQLERAGYGGMNINRTQWVPR